MTAYVLLVLSISLTSLLAETTISHPSNRLADFSAICVEYIFFGF